MVVVMPTAIVVVIVVIVIIVGTSIIKPLPKGFRRHVRERTHPRHRRLIFFGFSFSAIVSAIVSVSIAVVTVERGEPSPKFLGPLLHLPTPGDTHVTDLDPPITCEQHVLGL